MADFPFMENTNNNRLVAMLILSALLLTNTGVLGAVGFNLSSYTVPVLNISWLVVLNTLGLGWVLAGVWKRQFGGG